MNTTAIGPPDTAGAGRAQPDAARSDARGRDAGAAGQGLPDGAAGERFAALLVAPPAAGDTAGGTADHTADHDSAAPAPDTLPSPMALFARSAQPAPAAEPAAPVADATAAPLALRIETLAVATSADGRRSVRLTLADQALPDTEVELGHDGGALQVVFFCRRPEGRAALEHQAPALAETLAGRLRREVCVSVGGPQRDEPGRVQAHARPAPER